MKPNHHADNKGMDDHATRFTTNNEAYWGAGGDESDQGDVYWHGKD